MEEVIDKKTLVLGASLKESRFSNRALRLLRANNFPVVAIGNKEGMIDDVYVSKGLPEKPLQNIHTITLYLNPQNQVMYYDFILSLKPQRIIFNPGTENLELIKKAEEAGINCIENCTLIMISNNVY